MSPINHLDRIYEIKTTCKKCNKDYLQWTEEQIAGFRDRDYDFCPYCGAENGSSMEVEFHNRKMD